LKVKNYWKQIFLTDIHKTQKCKICHWSENNDESFVFPPSSPKGSSPQKLFPKGGKILNISQFYGQPFSNESSQIVDKS
jgi:hypothetical protein